MRFFSFQVLILGAASLANGLLLQGLLQGLAKNRASPSLSNIAKGRLIEAALVKNLANQASSSNGLKGNLLNSLGSTSSNAKNLITAGNLLQLIGSMTSDAQALLNPAQAINSTDLQDLLNGQGQFTSVLQSLQNLGSQASNAATTLQQGTQTGQYDSNSSNQIATALDDLVGNLEDVVTNLFSGLDNLDNIPGLGGLLGRVLNLLQDAVGNLTGSLRSTLQNGAATSTSNGKREVQRARHFKA